MKTYVITGSTSGIGKAITEELAKDKTNIIFAGYRNENKIPQKYPENISYFYMNMADSNSIIKTAQYLKTKIQHIDTLINVAGSVTAGPIEKIEIKRLKEQFDINTFSHLEFTQNLMDLLDNSKIINISSMASFGQFPFISPYCASKRALDIFFNALGIENHKNLKIVSVKPGVIATPIWETSVEANLKSINNCEEYKTELEFIKNNALKNSTKGLSVNKVVELVVKIDKLKNPKSSYTIGADAKFAQILSLLPQDFINKIIKTGMKMRIKSI